MYRIAFKRFIDFIISAIAIVFLLPVFICVTILLIIANKGNPFFTQKRPGKNNHIFKVIKFKTMNDKKDSNGVLLADKERLTTVGKFIRSTSLDEIPQLINVFIGQMSLIGPRPLLVKYLPLYSTEQARRHLVRPGITGWAQVNGRNSIGWDEKFSLDVWYVDNISFLLDLRIFWMTFLKVVKRADINNADTATMIPFEGNQN